MTGKPPQDWNMPVAEAMRILSELQRRPGLELSDKDRAALGAGRMALVQFLPGERKRVSEPMLANALRVCPQLVLESLAAAPRGRMAWMLECAMNSYVHHFNRYRSPPQASRRRPGGR